MAGWLEANHATATEATGERRLVLLVGSSAAGEEVPPLARAQAALTPIGQETPVPPSPQ